MYKGCDLLAQIRTYTALVKEINKRVTIAVKNVAEQVCEKLHDCIEEQYYNDHGFYPNVYERTEVFLNSAAYEILSSNSARVGIDIASMHYKNGFSARQVVDWARQSMHGSSLYKTDTEPFWDVFIEWADKNVLLLLKEELRKQKLNVK